MAHPRTHDPDDPLLHRVTRRKQTQTQKQTQIPIQTQPTEPP